MQTGNGGFLSFGSGGPYRQDIFERDVLMINALYYDKGYMSVQIGTPRVMLTPDREGIEITVAIHEGPRFKIRQLKIFERDNDGKEVEPLGGRRALRQMIRAHSGDWFNRAELIKDLTAVRTLYRDAGFANVEAEPETELDPGPERGRHRHPDPPRAAGPRRADRDQGEHQDARPVLRREMEIQEGQLFSETGSRDSKRRITALGYFERVDVSTEQGSAPDKIIINFEIGERPPARSRSAPGSARSRTSSRRRRCSRPTSSATGSRSRSRRRSPALRQLVSLRFFEPYFLGSDWSSNAELFDQLYVFPSFSRTSVGGSITYGYALIQPVAAPQRDGDRRGGPGQYGAREHVLRLGDRLLSIFQRLPLANLFNDGRTISLRPTLTYDTRDNRLFPSSGVFLQYSAEFANDIIGSEIQFLRHRFTGRLLLPAGRRNGSPGSGFVLKLNTEFGLITSPSVEGVPIFARFFLGGILDIRGFQLRTIGPRLPLNQSLDANSPPIANGADIGGNLEATRTLSSSSRSWTRSASAASSSRRRQRVEHGAAVLQDHPRAAVPRGRVALLHRIEPHRAAHEHRLRHPLVLPARPAALRVGLPARAAALRATHVFEFTIGNFF
jgi:outer membrane protein insertion porin family